jgi:WD40 repeat protein
MLYHNNSLEHILFNDTDELLTSIDSKGVIKIWSMESGRLLRKICHSSTVSCCCWGADASQLLVGYQNIELYGIRSSNVLKEYRCGGEGGSGQQEYLLDMAITSNNADGSRVFGFGQTGAIRVFNHKTQEQINMIHINRNSSVELIKVVKALNREGDDIFYVCTNRFVIAVNTRLEQ